MSVLMSALMPITLTNITVDLGTGAQKRRALDAISLSFQPGEQVAIIGPSGAGKTTLLHTLGMAIKPANGAISMFAVDPWQLSNEARHKLRANVFLAPQAPPLPPRQRVVNAVLAGRLPSMSAWQALRSLAYPLDAPAAANALGRFKLEDKLTLRCDRLSGGERQRVGLARMLLSAAPLILLDEPVSSLDPVLGAAALQTVQEEAATRKATLVVSLHDVNLAKSRFSRLIGVREGRVQFDLPANALTDDALVALYGGEFSLAVSAFALPEAPPEKADAAPALTRCF